MKLRRTATAALLGASLVIAAPTAATADRGENGRGGDRAGQSFDRSDVPSRVSSRLKRADRALDRAADAVDDGNATAAASALKSVRSNVAAAAKAAKKRSATDNGPDSFYAVARTQHKVVGEVTSLFDGADDATVTALTETLNASIDGRDDLVATIAALPADSQGDYSFVIDRIADDVADEIESIDEALSDDSLSTGAQTALTEARAKLVATQSAVGALNTSTTSTEGSGSSTAANDEDCPEGERGGRGSSNGSRGSSSQEAPQT